MNLIVPYSPYTYFGTLEGADKKLFLVSSLLLVSLVPLISAFRVRWGALLGFITLISLEPIEINYLIYILKGGLLFTREDMIYLFLQLIYHGTFLYTLYFSYRSFRNNQMGWHEKNIELSYAQKGGLAILFAITFWIAVMVGFAIWEK